MATPQELKAMARIKERYGKYIVKASEDTGLSIEHIYNLIYTESGGKADSVGTAGDAGLAQIIPGTALMIAKELGYTDFKDEADLARQMVKHPGLNILFGAKHYKDALDMSPDDPVLAYSRYNAGRSYPGKSDFHKGVFDRISARDLGGEDQISMNAARFKQNYSIMGYDPYNPATAPGPAAPAAPVANEWLPANRDIHRDPYADTPSSLTEGATPGGGYQYTPEQSAKAQGFQEQMYNHPLTGLPLRFVENAVQSGSLGYAPVADLANAQVGAPEGFAQQAAAAGGNVAGMLGAMGGLGLAGPAGFAAYGGLHKAPDLKSHLKGAAYNAALATGLGVGGRVAAKLGRAVLPRAAADATAKALGTRPGRMATDVPVFTGLELAHGKPIGEALAAGIGGAAAAGAVHGPIARLPIEGPLKVKDMKPEQVKQAWAELEAFGAEPKLQKTPAEMEVPGKQDLAQRGLAEPGELAALKASRLKPMPGVRTSETLTGNRDINGRHNVEGVISALENGGFDGYIAPARRSEIAKEATRNVMKTGIKKKLMDEGMSEQAALGEVFKKIGEATDRAALAEVIDPDFVAMVDGQRAANLEGAAEAGPRPELNISRARKVAQAFVSPIRFWQGRGGGGIGFKNVVDKVLVRGNQEIQDYTMDMQDQFTQSKIAWAEKFGVTKMSQAARNSITERMEKGDLSDPAVAALKYIYESHHALMTRGIVALGGEAPGYIENYAGPEFEARPGTMNIPARIKGSVMGKGRKEESQRLDTPSKKSLNVNPRRRHRTGSVENPEMDPLKRLDQFNMDLAYDLGHNLGLRHNEAYARYLEVNGMERMADSIRDYSNDIYNNKTYGLPAALREVSSLPGVRTIHDTLSWTRRRLYESVFPLNLLWTMTVQPSSSAQTGMNSGADNAAKATKLMFSPEFRDLVDGLYSAQLKSRGKGGLFRRASEDNSVLTAKDHTNTSVREDVMNLASSPGAAMERNLGYYSAAARFLMGKKLNLTEREMLDFMSDGIMKDQSMYDSYNRSAFLKSPELNNALPFKSFMLELVENVAEQTGGKWAQHGQFDIAGEKGMSQMKHNIGATASLATGIIIANFVNEQAKGRPVYSASSIPGYDEMTGAGAAQGSILPANLLRQYQQGRSKAHTGLREGNPYKMAQGMFRSVSSFMPAGAQMKRLIDTEAARHGADPFPVKGAANIAHSAIVGPSGTMAGREYWDRRKGGNKDESILEIEMLKRFMYELDKRGKARGR